MTDSRDPLPEVIREVVEIRLEEPEIAAGFARVQATRGQREQTRWRPLIAVGASAAAALLIYWAWTAEPSPTRLALGPASVEDTARTVTAGDGSAIDIAGGTQLTLVTDDARAVELSLEEGEVTLDVPPGRGRTWRVRAGEVTVEVVGTRFSVRRSGAHVEVEVTRGTVRIRGDGVEGGLLELTAGERWPAEPASTRTEADAPEEPPVPEPAPAEDRQPSPTPAEPATAPRRQPARETEAPPPAAPEPTAEEQLALADRARAEGRVQDGLDHLAAAARSGGPAAGVASVSRAQWLLELGRVREAAADLERARRATLPRALRETLMALRVQALSRSGNHDGAAAASREYDEAFPSGSFARENRRWLDAPAP